MPTGHYLAGNLVRRSLERVRWVSDSQVSFTGRSRRKALLHDVGQLVRQQPPSFAYPRRVPPRPEHHVLPDRVSQRTNGFGRPGRPRIGVHSDPAEVVAETRLHEDAGSRSSGLPGERSTSFTMGGTVAGAAWFVV